jgi:chaperonin GroES
MLLDYSTNRYCMYVLRRRNYKMNLLPTGDRIVVLPDESEETTASGIIIPDQAQQKPHQGTVVAVGPGIQVIDTGEYMPLELEVGDVVLYSKYGGTEVIHNDQELMILTMSDVLARVINE